MTPAEARAAAVTLRGRAVDWARSYGLGAAAAEDVAHDALELLLNKAAEVRPECAIAWLRSTIYNLARASVRPRREILTDVVPEPPAPGLDPEDTLRSREVSASVRAALGRLAASRRTILEAVELDEKPLAQVAREEGIPESAARVRADAGVEQLRADLHRQRVAEQRRTGGHSSWAVLLGLGDVRAIARRVTALGAAAAGGALLHFLIAEPTLGPTSIEAPPRAAIAEPLVQATGLPAAERGTEAPTLPGRFPTPADASGPRSRHDVHARMLAERFGR